MWHARRALPLTPRAGLAQPEPVQDAGATVDLLVVGAGIVGLAHAVEARSRGLRVVVVDRDARAVGASVRNFGHGCVTAQVGIGLERALHSRSRWLEVAREAGVWAREAGTLVVARAEDELDVLRELAADRDGQVVLVDRDQVVTRLGTEPDDVRGGALLPLDVRVDPRTAVADLAAWLDHQPEVEVRFRTTVRGLAEGGVDTSRGPIAGDRVVVCVGHDVDHLFPVLADDHGLARCHLHMLRVAPPSGHRIDPGVLSGSSLLRYPAFAACPSAARVRARITAEDPELIEARVNLMCTQLPDGDLLVGDTHHDDVVASPFAAEHRDRLLLDRAARLLGVRELEVRERWQGVYATAADDFLVAAPDPATRIVAVTTGIGMTTAFGLARDVLDDLLEPGPARSGVQV